MALLTSSFMRLASMSVYVSLVSVHASQSTQAVGIAATGSVAEARDGDYGNGVRREAGRRKLMESTARDNTNHVIYGIITNKQPRYQHKLTTVMDTWAAIPKTQGRLVVMGGRDYPVDQVKGVTAADCDDLPSGNPCKEASLVVEAAKRNASWLFIVGEDNYVDIKLIETALKTERTDIPVGLGYIGCGRGAPDVLERYGKELYTYGGFCGSCGEALNHASLQRMVKEGPHTLVKEYGNGNDCDMATSAAMYKRNIPMRAFPGRLIGTPIFRRKELEREMAGNAMTFHYVTPEAMRWVHAKKTGVAKKELRDIESAAFIGQKRSCLAGMTTNNNAVWKKEIQTCLAEE